MPRLYGWLMSDTAKEVTRQGNEHMNIQVNYGSAKDSRELVIVNIVWLKGEDKPTVVCDVADGVKLLSNRHPLVR